VCTGGVLALELARSLEREGFSGLGGLILVATEVPPESPHQLYQGGDVTSLVRALIASGTIPPEIAEDADMLEIVLPTLLADLRAIEGHAVKRDPVVSVPILILRDAFEALTTPGDSYASWPIFASRVHVSHLSDAANALTRDPRSLALAVMENLGFLGCKRGGELP
jgi:surfactin synthase thioesterase subunit